MQNIVIMGPAHPLRGGGLTTFNHEKRPGDDLFTHYFLKSCNGFITMSEKVMSDLKCMEKVKPAQLVAHPLYDNFGVSIPKTIAREKLGLKKDEKVILFFGFIGKYKGLYILFQAMADPRIKTSGIKLLVAGEFYEDEKVYQDQMDVLGIRNQLILHTNFIPDVDALGEDFFIPHLRSEKQKLSWDSLVESIKTLAKSREHRAKSKMKNEKERVKSNNYVVNSLASSRLNSCPHGG